MITSGFKNAVSQMLSNGGTAKGLLPIKDVSGTTVYLADYDDFPYDVETGFTLTASAAGISIGSGNTAVTEGDYQLATPITSGLTGSVTVDKGVESGSAYITLNVVLTNTSASSITVSEICYKQEFKVASTQGGTTTSTAVCMVDRSLLDTPIAIAASGQAVLSYKLKASLSSGGGTLVPKTITQNGVYDPEDDSADGYSLVTVNVAQSTLITKTISANGTYEAQDDNADGYSEVSVSVSPNVGTKSITQNGTYNASSDSLDGYSQVSVNVSGGGVTFYLDNGQIATSEGYYITTNLSQQLPANTLVLLSINDNSYGVKNYIITYTGGTMVLPSYDYDGYEITITPTTIGLTYYGGDWRNIYAKLSELDPTQIY